jgi:nuclear respiratory factor 1
VRNCYKHHGREDLLPDFSGEETVPQMAARLGHTMLQAITNPDGSISIIQIDTGDADTSQVLTLADGTQAQVVQVS